MKRNVAVNIAGQRYVLRSDGDDNSVRELASYVDARIKETQRQTRSADTQALAVLAALQVAEELFALRETHADLKRKVRERSRALLQFLDTGARV